MITLDSLFGKLFSNKNKNNKKNFEITEVKISKKVRPKEVETPEVPKQPLPPKNSSNSKKLKKSQLNSVETHYYNQIESLLKQGNSPRQIFDSIKAMDDSKLELPKEKILDILRMF
jgi:hypothetical protein